MDGEMFSGTFGEMELIKRHILMLKATKQN